MSLVIELQTASGGPGGASYQAHAQSRLSTKAWAKIDLFDVHGRLISGRWRVPMRITPINPVLSTRDLLSVPQVWKLYSNALFGIMWTVLKEFSQFDFHYKTCA